MNARGRWDWLNSFGTNRRRMGARSSWISDQIRTLPPQVTTGMRNGASTQMAGVRIHAHGRARFACVRANEATSHAVAEASNVGRQPKGIAGHFLEPFCASERTRDEGTARTGEIGVKERCRRSNERSRKKPIGVEGFKKGGRAEEERADRKEGAAEEEVINGNEDCLAKCEWPASEDIDGRMDGWTGGSPRALSQQIRHINKTWTSYLSREREAPAKYHASGNLHTFKASTPELSEAVRANIPRVNRRPFKQQEDGPSGEDKMVKKRKKKLRYHRFEVIRRRMNIRTELTTYPPIAPIFSLDPSRSESSPSTSGSFHKARPAYH
ncbi:hypothetical protein ALC56_06722 [Trachymyrmex septentrionalis]|uniref:Uncharacterized protein n=1 Tax=Trachymyrmex septentrionalis TaxID=34720 RepID=A0A195FE93_9HYME|nr:hypothetical protein ALC56_06722 [Trachymyrmex septentrionalis]